MSYEKLKHISVIGVEVHFYHKSSNTTDDYKPGKCTLAEFLHNSVGNIFQYAGTKFNSIVQEFKKAIGTKEQVDQFWWNVENYGIEDSRISDRERYLFAHYQTEIFES